MHEPNAFLANLAIVLGVAAITTVVFQRLRQPVVFGYMLAGLVIGPHLPVPLVADREIVSARTRRLIDATKEFLQAHVANPIRLRDVGRAVGASPTYLTDVFRRVEGVPLHRYVMQLRLSRALVELPHASDLTTLALDQGFSSHSHFTSAFKRAFDCTPSEFRSASPAAARARLEVSG